MRLRVALDVTEIRDPEVREAVDEFVGLEDAVLELNDKNDVSKLDTLLQKSREAQEQLATATKKLASQYSAVSNAVLGYQAASLRSSDTNKYKASFVRALLGVTSGIKRALNVIIPEKTLSEKTARVARVLCLAEGITLNNNDFSSALENQVNQLAHKAKTIVQFVARNDELIDELTDIMQALGVGDISAQPQAPMGPVTPTPVPESPSNFQQPVAPQGEPEKVEEPR